MCRYLLEGITITIWSVTGFTQYLNQQIGEQKAQSCLGGHLKEQGRRRREKGQPFFWVTAGQLRCKDRGIPEKHRIWVYLQYFFQCFKFEENKKKGMQFAEVEVQLRIIEYLELQGTHNNHWVQMPKLTKLGSKERSATDLNTVCVAWKEGWQWSLCCKGPVHQ